MNKYTNALGVALLLTGLLGGCSSVKEMTGFGDKSQDFKDDEALLIPPSLKMPADTDDKKNTAISSSSINTSKVKAIPTVPTTKQAKSLATPLQDRKNYYVVVGTYPSQEEALDTFVRLSSIGLPNSTMETRMTKSGQQLHMVRLGPFQDQDKIDKVKDSLLSDGLSQFKVVEN